MIAHGGARTTKDIDLLVDASVATLIRTKETDRPSDAADRRYLQALLDAERE